MSRSEGVKGLRDSAGKNHVGKEDAIEVEGTVRESLPNTARQENDPGGNRTIDLDVLLAGCADDSFDDGIRIDTALVIDNVPSQANRLEEALRLDRHAPAVDLRLTAPPKVPELTRQLSSLQFPHRNADAYLRDAQLDGEDFFGTDLGRAIFAATPQTCGPLLALVGKKRQNVKHARAWVSERTPRPVRCWSRSGSTLTCSPSGAGSRFGPAPSYARLGPPRRNGHRPVQGSRPQPASVDVSVISGRCGPSTPPWREPTAWSCWTSRVWLRR